MHIGNLAFMLGMWRVYKDCGVHIKDYGVHINDYGVYIRNLVCI